MAPSCELHLALRFCEEELRRFFAQCGRDVPALRDVDLHHDLYRDEYIVRLDVGRAPDSAYRFVLPCQYVRNGGSISSVEFRDAFRALYADLFDEYELHCEMTRISEHIAEAMVRGVEPAEIRAMQAHAAHHEQHIRLHQRQRRRRYRDDMIDALSLAIAPQLHSVSVDIGTTSSLPEPPPTAIQIQDMYQTLHQFMSVAEPAPQTGRAIQARQRQAQREFSERMSDAVELGSLTAGTVVTVEMLDELRMVMRHDGVGFREMYLGADWSADDAGARKEAEEKGLKLLKEWLSPEQLASYEKNSHFEVIGGETGARYRIKHGRQMNIEQLDEKGNPVVGLCFLPQGQLVAGDCMLAQKLALETHEHDALKVANRFPVGLYGTRADVMITDDIFRGEPTTYQGILIRYAEV